MCTPSYVSCVCVLDIPVRPTKPLTFSTLLAPLDSIAMQRMQNTDYTVVSPSPVSGCRGTHPQLIPPCLCSTGDPNPATQPLFCLPPWSCRNCSKSSRPGSLCFIPPSYQGETSFMSFHSPSKKKMELTHSIHPYTQ